MASFQNRRPGAARDEVVYCEANGCVRHAVIYTPRFDAPLKTACPALVCVHGGAWVSGDRFSVTDLAVPLAERGIAVMAIDTRLAPQYPYPAAVADVNCAVRYLRYHAGKYHVHPGQIGGLGISSGAFLVWLAAAKPNDSLYTSEKPFAVPPAAAVPAYMGCVITCSGVLDPFARYQMAEKMGARDILLCHHAFFRDFNTMAQLRPENVLQACPVGKADLPNALFFQGTMDARVPAGTADKMAKAWAQAGGKAEAVIYPGAGHSIGTWGEAHFSDMVNRIAACVFSMRS